MLYDPNSARLALGCMMIKPSLALDDRHPLDKADFEPTPFHLRLYQAINALAKRGAGAISAMDVYGLCKNNAEVKAVFDSNDVTGFIDAVKQLAVLDNYELYWTNIRRCSLLREYQAQGFPIDRFESEPEKYSIEEIVAYYDAKLSAVNKRFYVNANREEYVAGSDFAKTKEQWKESPDYGPSFQSPYLNAINRGMTGLILRAGKSGGGKAQPVDTVIPTPDGFKKMGDIQVGDYVYDRCGKPTKVLGVFPQGVIDCYTVTLADGRKTKCNDQHLWSYYHVSNKNNERRHNPAYLVTSTLGEIAKMRNHVYIPTCEAVEFEPKEYPLDPYVVGSLLGNGCCLESALTISSSDEENVAECARLMGCKYKKAHPNNYSWLFVDDAGKRLSTRLVLGKLADNLCNYSHAKSVPPEYKYGSIAQRLALVQGLLDTDGNIAVDGGRYNVTFSTTSKQLADDLREVMFSLGCCCNVLTQEREGRRTCYKVTLLVSNDYKQQLFRLSRKKKIAQEAASHKKRRYYDRIGIRKIEKDAEPQEMVCLYVDNSEHLYLTNDYIVTHNTATSVGDICKICCTKYWDFGKHEFVQNKSRLGPCLFINTEMDMRKELDPLIIAWISGVSRGKIKDGYYEGDEEARVDYANKVLAESKLYIVDDPLFTTKSLMTTIKEYASLKGIKAACFDYIQNNGVVASEIASESKIAQREDMVLLALTDRLKQVQRICGIPVLTGVQTNGQEDGMKYPTEACLAGAKAQVRKTDGTVVMLPPKPDEEELFEMAKSNPAMNIPVDAVCNNVTHIIKGRNSRFPKHVKIFQTISYGTARSRDWFATDKDGNQVDGLHGLLIETDGRREV